MYYSFESLASYERTHLSKIVAYGLLCTVIFILFIYNWVLYVQK